MSKVVVQSIGMSLDGFAAGANQSIDEPLGVHGRDLMDWFMSTKTFVEPFGGKGGEVFGDMQSRSESRLAIIPDTTHVTLMNRMTTIVPMINDFLDARPQK